MKIGLFGGTFDPIHNAHLKLAEKILEEYALDKIIFIPSGTSYFKKDVTNKWSRYQMVELAIKHYQKFFISDIETKRDGNSYAYDTIIELKKQNPENIYFWIMGSDTFLQLPSWKNHTYLLKNLNFIVYIRPGDSIKEIKESTNEYKKKYFTNIDLMENDPFFVSSSEIRKHMHTGALNHPYLPACIETYIIKHNLY